VRQAGGLTNAPPTLLDQGSLRTTQVREVLIAFLSQGKVLLDLLAQGVASALGNPRGFKEKHGGLGVHLDEFARAGGVAAPPAEVVNGAQELDLRVADARDDLLVHPKLSGDFARQFVHPRGGDLEIGTLWPSGDEQEAQFIDIDGMDAAEAYTREVVRWVASILGSPNTAG
jgi:hypothetical protein